MFRYCERVVDLNPELSDRTLDFLAQVACAPITWAEGKVDARCRACKVSFVLWVGAAELGPGRFRRAAPVKPSDTEDAMTHGIFVWNELYTRDVEAAKAFYAATVGWTFEGMPMPDRDRTYWIAKAEGKPVAGILDMRGIVPDGDPPHWLSYLEVDDVDRRIAEIERNGGRIVRQPFDVPDFGRIAIGADATGAFMAWVTTKR